MEAVNTHYVQILVCVAARGVITSRWHLRFREGDDSYNCLWKGEVFVGLLHDAELARRARSFAEHWGRELQPLLQRTSFEEAGLRPEDSAMFLQQVLTGTPLVLAPESEAQPVMVQASVGNPGQQARKGTFGADSLEALPLPIRALVAEGAELAATIAGCARAPSRATPSPPAAKPWWRFW